MNFDKVTFRCGTVGHDGKPVNQRIEDTKQEIQTLQQQLQEILDLNIRSKTIHPDVRDMAIKSKTKLSQEIFNQLDDNIEKRQEISSGLSCAKSNVSVDTQDSGQKKSRHYDSKVAQEYIKKKREERVKHKQDNQQKLHFQEMRKQKLKELHMKSIQILKENVKRSVKKGENAQESAQKQEGRSRSLSRESKADGVRDKCRSRSVSREPRKPATNPINKQTVNVRKTSPKSAQRPNVKYNKSNVLAKAGNSSQLKVPQDAVTCEKEPLHSNVSLERDEQRNAAAIKIQATFRGYRQRKKYKRLQKVREVVQKPTFNVPSNDVKKTPAWLLPPPTLPYPYNFISTVRKKLDFATRNMNQSLDTSTQYSQQENVKAAKIEVGVCVPEPTSKVIDVQIHVDKQNEASKSDSAKRLQESLRGVDVSDSDTARNIPEISEEEQRPKHPFAQDTAGQKIPDLQPPKLSLTKDRLDDSLQSDRQERLANPFKYPSDIDLIISNYSKNKKSSQYSDDFHSIPNDSDTKTKSMITEEISAASKRTSPAVDTRHISFTRNHSVSKDDFFNSNPSTIEILNGGKSESDTIPTSTKHEITTDSFTTQQSSKTGRDYDMSSLKTNSDSNSVVSKVSTRHVRRPAEKTDELSEVSTESNYYLNLVRPSINLKSAPITEREGQDVVYTPKRQCLEKNPNEILLKIEAELRVTNSINQNVSQLNKPSSFKSPKQRTSDVPVSNINFKRGCDLSDTGSELSLLGPSVCSADLDLSNVTHNTTVHSIHSKRSQEKHQHSNGKSATAVSIDVFDQMIKDEESRIEHLNTMLKLREKTMLDRTKGELAWLEIQKKQLRDSGQLIEVSAVKKKQRGLIIKLQEEHHEMQRLKQVHRQASKDRKKALIDQKNLIKLQLGASNISTKIKRTSRSERRQSGPLKVFSILTKTEEIQTETSVSCGNSIVDEVINYSASKVLTQSQSNMTCQEEKPTHHLAKVERVLMMKEIELRKRREKAQTLLKWHDNLREEEEKVSSLERAATTLTLGPPKKQKLVYGAQLNGIWSTLSKTNDKKYCDQDKYLVSKARLEKLVRKAKDFLHKINEGRMKKGKPTYSVPEFDLDSSFDMLNDVSDLSIQFDTDASMKSDRHIRPTKDQSNQTSDSEKRGNARVQEDRHHTSIPDVILANVLFPSISPNQNDLTSQSEHVKSDEDKSNLQTTNSYLSELHSRSTHYKSEDNEPKTDVPSQPSLINSTKSIDVQIISSSPEIQKNLTADAITEHVTVDLSNPSEEHTENISQEDLSIKSFIGNTMEDSESSKSSCSTIKSEVCLVIPDKIADDISEDKYKSVSADNSPHDLSSVDDKDETRLSESSDVSVHSAVEDRSIKSVDLLSTSLKSPAEDKPTVSESFETIKTATVQDEHNCSGSDSLSANINSQEGAEISTNASSLESLPSAKCVASQEIEETITEAEYETDSFITEPVKAQSPEDVPIEDADCSESKIGDLSDGRNSIGAEQTELDHPEVESPKLTSEDTYASDFEPITNKSTEQTSETSLEIVEDVQAVGDLSEVDVTAGVRHIDVRKRVSEIVADANNKRDESKSPRLQDLYVTAYDVSSSVNDSPEIDSAMEDQVPETTLRRSLYGNEEAELLKKQFEIEKEIKQLEAQQKKNLPLCFVREIPNKPPPPYKPPVGVKSNPTIIPSSKESVLVHISDASALIFKAHADDSFDETFTVQKHKSIDSSRFIFDICKETALQIYKPGKSSVPLPSWKELPKRLNISDLKRPTSRAQLESLLKSKVLQLLGFQSITTKDNLIIRWSRKKRDHVDEILVLEAQTEEANWTNYDQDQLFVKEMLVDEILEELLLDAVRATSNILSNF